MNMDMKFNNRNFYYTAMQDYPIKNVLIYKFKDEIYDVSFDVNNSHKSFRGTREQIVPQMAVKLKRILNIR